jgi:hypothetical protein
MAWYAKRFADGEVKLRQRGSQPEFAEVFHVFAQHHAGAAVFCGREVNGAVTIYLPPVAAEFARMIQASEIDKPPRDGLQPMYGGSAALDRWFGH